MAVPNETLIRKQIILTPGPVEPDRGSSQKDLNGKSKDSGPLAGRSRILAVPNKILFGNRMILGPWLAGAGLWQFPIRFDQEIDWFWAPSRLEPDRGCLQ